MKTAGSEMTPRALAHTGTPAGDTPLLGTIEHVGG